MRTLALLALFFLAFAALGAAGPYDFCDVSTGECSPVATDADAGASSIAPSALAPSIPLINVDTVRHVNAAGQVVFSAYSDRKGAQFQIGKDALQLRFKLQGLRAGELVAVYLVNDAVGKRRLCVGPRYSGTGSPGFQDDNPGVFQIVFTCAVPSDFAPGNYRVYVVLRDAQGNVLSRGGKPARYWGYADDSYFVTLVSAGSAMPLVTTPPLQEPPGTASIPPKPPVVTLPNSLPGEKRWGASFELFYGARPVQFSNTPDSAGQVQTGEKTYSKKFSVLPDSANGVITVPLTGFAAGDRLDLTELALTLFDSKGSVICEVSAGRDDLDALSPLSNDADCGKTIFESAPTNLLCGAANRKDAIAVHYCKIDSGVQPPQLVLRMVSYARSDLYANNNKPADQVLAISHATPYVPSSRSFLKTHLELDSRHLVDFVPVPLPPKTPLSAVSAKALLETRDSCYSISKDLTVNPASSSDPYYTVTYDPLCGGCGTFDLMNISIAGVTTKPQTISATTACQADNLVLTTNKLKLTKPLQVALRRYLKNHPMRSRLVFIDSDESLAYSSISTQDDPVENEISRRLQEKVNPRQIVLLGDYDVLPKFTLPTGGKNSAGGAEEIKTDDAYSLLDEFKMPKIPVGRIQGIKGEDTKNSDSLKDILENTADALAFKSGSRSYLLVSGSETLSGKDSLVRRDGFVSGYSGQTWKACQATGNCLPAPEYCLGSVNLPRAFAADCTQKDAYAKLLSQRAFLALLADEIDLDKTQVLSHSKVGAQWVLLAKQSLLNFLTVKKYSLDHAPIVFLGGADSRTTLPLTLGAGAVAVVSSYGSALPDSAYSDVGTALSPRSVPEGHTGRVLLGDAFLNAKNAVYLLHAHSAGAKASDWLASAYRLTLNGDPAFTLVDENAALTPAPEPSPSLPSTGSGLMVPPAQASTPPQNAPADSVAVETSVSLPNNRQFAVGYVVRSIFPDGTEFTTIPSSRTYSQAPNAPFSIDVGLATVQAMPSQLSMLSITLLDADKPYGSREVCYVKVPPSDVSSHVSLKGTGSSDCLDAPTVVECAAKGDSVGIRIRFCSLKTKPKTMSDDGTSIGPLTNHIYLTLRADAFQVPNDDSGKLASRTEAWTVSKYALQN